MSKIGIQLARYLLFFVGLAIYPQSSGPLSLAPQGSPVGTLYYATDQTTCSPYYYWDGHSWIQLLSAGPSGSLACTTPATVDINPSVVPRLAAANSFTGINTFSGNTTVNNLTVTGSCSGCGAGGFNGNYDAGSANNTFVVNTATTDISAWIQANSGTDMHSFGYYSTPSFWEIKDLTSSQQVLQHAFNYAGYGPINSMFTGLVLNTAGKTQPPCVAATRATLWYNLAASNASDSFQVCQKDSFNNYSWVPQGFAGTYDAGTTNNTLITKTGTTDISAWIQNNTGANMHSFGYYSNVNFWETKDLTNNFSVLQHNFNFFGRGPLNVMFTGLQLNTAGRTQPYCDINTRGTIWVLQSGSGTADRTQVCLKDSADNYNWKTLITN